MGGQEVWTGKSYVETERMICPGQMLVDPDPQKSKKVMEAMQRR
jgi:hypothetical protein